MKMGGRVAATDRQSTPPRLPMPLPPYSVASLFKASRQKPPCGAPIRYSCRGTGVKLQTISTKFAVDFPLRIKLTTLLSASPQSIHSKPAGSQSSSCSAGSLR